MTREIFIINVLTVIFGTIAFFLSIAALTVFVSVGAYPVKSGILLIVIIACVYSTNRAAGQIFDFLRGNEQ